MNRCQTQSLAEWGSALEGAWLHDTKWKISSKRLLSPPNHRSNKKSGGLTCRAQGRDRKDPTPFAWT